MRTWRFLLAAAAISGCGAPDDGGRAGSGATLPDSHDADKFEFGRVIMGSPVRIVFYAKDTASAEAAAEASFAVIAEVDAAMSDYKSDSELSRLNAAAGGEPRPVSPPLFDVLEIARRISESSEGAFDVTVGPVVLLWRRARTNGTPPDPAALKSAAALVGYRGLTLDRGNRTARLERPGMKIDLGGIAKGYAADRALAALRARGFSRAFVACAGDIALGDPPPGKPGWRVSIAGDRTKVVVAARCGVSTSGDAEQYLEVDGRRYSHIINPRTGAGTEHIALATVVAPDDTTADALATALVVMGPESGIELVRSMTGVEARLVWRVGKTLKEAQTRGMNGLMEIK